MKVVCIGAHPDDVELGMAGTVARHASRGDDVHIIICTLGIGGESGDPKVREVEANKAAKILGAQVHILDYPVLKLNSPSKEFEAIISRVIYEMSPDRIYTHSPLDYHQVHEAVCDAVTNAAINVPQLLYYEVASSTNPEFRPNAFVDITEYIGSKIECLRIHSTQGGKLYMQETIARSLAQARYVLSKIGTKPNGMAEAFSIYRFVVNSTKKEALEKEQPGRATAA
jgi:LmbE family N-acetylglucosaminyl deacetylase